MEYLTWLLAADEEACAEIASTPQPLNQWSGIELPGFDTLRLVTLHALLTGDGMQVALDRYEPVFICADDTLVLRVADELLEAVDSLDEEAMSLLTSELAATEEFEDAQWSEENALELLSAFSDLAQLAESQGQSLFLAIRPLDSADE